MLTLTLWEVKHNAVRSRRLRSRAIILLNFGKRALRRLARVGFAVGGSNELRCRQAAKL
jgi:hypothetical protein